MKSAPQAPAFAASLNISGANIGIGLGAVVGGDVIDRLGLPALGWSAALILVAALVLAIGLMTRTRRQAAAVCDGMAG